MVTGRELSDLFNTFEHSSLFDVIVAENGAVLYHPTTEAVELRSSTAPRIHRATDERAHSALGRAFDRRHRFPHEHEVLEAIREFQLEWHVIFNKGSVMALPANVTKATGLGPALEAVGVLPERTAGIGDPKTIRRSSAHAAWRWQWPTRSDGEGARAPCDCRSPGRGRR